MAKSPKKAPSSKPADNGKGFVKMKAGKKNDKNLEKGAKWTPPWAKKSKK